MAQLMTYEIPMQAVAAALDMGNFGTNREEIAVRLFAKQLYNNNIIRDENLLVHAYENADKLVTVKEVGLWPTGKYHITILDIMMQTFS